MLLSLTHSCGARVFKVRHILDFNLYVVEDDLEYALFNGVHRLLLKLSLQRIDYFVQYHTLEEEEYSVGEVKVIR